VNSRTAVGPSIPREGDAPPAYPDYFTRVRRRLALAASACLLLPTVALGAGGEPRFRPTAADQRLATAGVFTAKDAGPGYRRDPLRLANVLMPRCAGAYPPSRSDLTVTGRAESFLIRASDALGTSVEVFRSQTETQAWWRRVVRPQFATCVGRMSVTSLPPGVAATLVSAKPMPVNKRFADRQARYRVVVRYRQRSDVFVFYQDVFFFSTGRAVGVAMMLTRLRQPCDCIVGAGQEMWAKLMRAPHA
jgi:hypothetical protein